MLSSRYSKLTAVILVDMIPWASCVLESSGVGLTSVPLPFANDVVDLVVCAVLERNCGINDRRVVGLFQQVWVVGVR